MRSLILAATLLFASTFVLAQEIDSFSYDGPGFSVVLPSGFTVNQILDDNLPDFASYSFVNNESYHLVGISIHTYIEEANRSLWGSGEYGGNQLSHLTDVTLIESPTSAFPVSFAYSFRGPEGQGSGIWLFGCDRGRCYDVQVSGARAQEEGTVESLAGLLEQIRFDQ